MNPKYPLFTLALIGVLMTLALGAWRPVEQQNTDKSIDATCNTSRIVQVSGAAVINVVPDRVLIQLGIQSNGSTPDGVQSTNFAQMQKVTAAVRALGIETKDIATDYDIVTPIYEEYNVLSIKGYRIDNSISITLKDVSQVDKVIIAALKAGANEIRDIQFYTSELRKYRDQARNLAIKAAGEKASALATAAGAQTGCVTNISENTWSQYYGTWSGGRQATLWAQNTIQNAAPAQNGQSAGDDSPIHLGQIAVRAEVNASYTLK
jgi:uncharacterized protein